MANHLEDVHVLHEMKRTGGGFVRALAEAGFVADRHNLQRIKNAFPEYWGKYELLAAERAAKDKVAEGGQ